MILRNTLAGDLVAEEFTPRVFCFPGDEPAPYTPSIDASRNMQAEHVAANDTPIDVNPNAVHARFHAGTMDIVGRAMANNTDRREKMADSGVGIFKPV